MQGGTPKKVSVTFHQHFTYRLKLLALEVKENLRINQSLQVELKLRLVVPQQTVIIVSYLSG